MNTEIRQTSSAIYFRKFSELNYRNLQILLFLSKKRVIFIFSVTVVSSIVRNTITHYHCESHSSHSQKKNTHSHTYKEYRETARSSLLLIFKSRNGT